MKETRGKSVARGIFYDECLRHWLSPVELQCGNVLVLLGDEPRELPYLDKLGVPRGHIMSIENRYERHLVQLGQNLGVALFYGSVREYLEALLHHDQRIVAMNLDIEGSYAAQLDPAMASVLKFCWRNPSTVVATYHSIGRDRALLKEGVKSLVTLLWLSPGSTKWYLRTYADRYRRCGFPERTACHLMLRDLFWVRSMWEQSLVAAATLRATSLNQVQHVLAEEDALWSNTATAKTLPLHLRHLTARQEQRQVTHPQQVMLRDTPCLGLTIGDQKHVLYRASDPWIQRCYFTRFARTSQLISSRAWAQTVLRGMCSRPLSFVSRRGKLATLGHEENLSDKDFVIWEDADIYKGFRPRQVILNREAVRLEVVRQSLLDMTNYQEPLSSILHNGSANSAKNGKAKKNHYTPIPQKHSKEKREEDMATKYVEKGQLTKRGITFVRRLAGKGFNTADIIREFPAATRRHAPELAIRAHVAVSRRATK